MAKSRMARAAAALLLLVPGQALAQAASAPPAAPAISAKEAIARQERGLERSMGIGCDRDGPDADIVVCAPLNRGFIPFPEEEGRRKRLIAGEINDPGPISNLGSCCGPRGGLDVLKIGEVAGKIFSKIF